MNKIKKSKKESSTKVNCKLEESQNKEDKNGEINKDMIMNRGTVKRCQEADKQKAKKACL